MRPYQTLPAALLSLGLSGCGLDAATPSAPAAATGAAQDLVIVAQANVHGDIEPCG